MTSQDRTNHNEWMQNEDELKNILDEIAPPSIFNDIKQNKGAAWTPRFLVQCAFLLSTCNLPTLTESFDNAFRLFLALQSAYEKTSATFVGFIGQLVKYHAAIKERIIPYLRELTKTKLKRNCLFFTLVFWFQEVLQF